MNLSRERERERVRRSNKDAKCRQFWIICLNKNCEKRVIALNEIHPIKVEGRICTSNGKI